MHSRPLLVALFAAMPSIGGAVVVDDFTAGPITVATSGEAFDQDAATQTDLATDQVLFGGRHLTAQQWNNPVTLQIDTSDTGA